MPWPFQAHLLHVKNPILFFLGTASKLTLPILTALKQLRIHPVSQHWDYQRAGAGFSLSQFRVPKVKNANITSQSPATQRHQHRSVSQQQHSQTKFLCWKEPQLKHLKQLTGTSPRSTNVMWTGGFNESDVFIAELHKSASHCPTSSLPTQLLLKLFASVIESFSQTLYILLWFGDNAAEIRLPSIFLNVFNLNRRLKSKIVQLMDSSPSSTSTP